jgi:hypothetical protein
MLSGSNSDVYSVSDPKESHFLANNSKKRECPSCGEPYSRQRPRCPSCGEANDLLKAVPSRGSLLDKIPWIQDLPDTTKILIGAVGTFVAIAVGVVIFFLLARG